jgi:hypothetical protein
MTEYLYDVEFERVDRVRNPANPHSRIVLAKSASPDTEGVGSMSDDDKTKSENDEPKVLDLNDADAVAAFLAEHKPEGGTETVELTDETIAAAVAEMTDEQLADVAKAAGGKLVVKSADDDEPDEVERLIKSKGLDADAAEILRKNRDENRANAERIAKMEGERRIERFVKSAETDMGDLNEKPADLGRILADLATALGSDDHDVVKSITRVLKAASAQVAENTDLLTKAVGKDGERSISKAGREMDDLARDLAKSEGITFHQAKVRVAQSHPELVARHYSGD